MVRDYVHGVGWGYRRGISPKMIDRRVPNYIRTDTLIGNQVEENAPPNK